MKPLRTARISSILDAASALFVEHGYEKTRIDEIARAAGMGKGTVYEYFSSKADIFAALVRRMLEEQHAALEELTGSALPLREKLITMIRTLSSTVSQNQPTILSYAQIALRQNTDLCRILEEDREKLHQQVLTLVHAAVRSGELRDDLDPQYLSFLIGTLIPSFTVAVTAGRLPARETAADEIVDCLLSGIGKS